MPDREKLVELVDDYTDHLSIQDIHKADFAERFADYLIAHGVTVSQWIPVDERLPEVMDTYLVVVKAKYDWEDQYEIDTDVATYNPYEKAYIDGCWDTYCDWDEGQQYLHVTHWMPLPQPPKGE